jgi:hypothetical protein
MTKPVKTIVDHSETESEVLGLRISRCNQNLFDETELYSGIVAGQYDICRVKVASEDEFAPYRLEKTGLPYFFSGSIRRYKTRITEEPTGTYNYPDLKWEYYDGTQTELLKDMLVGTWGTYPIGYYRSPFLSELLDKEQEIESVFQFYKKNNDSRINPDNTIVFIKHGENYVGFFALNKLNGNLESHVGGILKPYRKGGYFLDKLRYIKEYCIDHQLEHFIFGARNENAEVQRIFQYVGFQPVGSENVFHVASLLSHSEVSSTTADLSLSKDPNKNYLPLLDLALTEANKVRAIQGRINFNVNHQESLRPDTQVLFTYPVLTEREILVVMKELNNPDSLFTAYLHIAV